MNEHRAFVLTLMVYALVAATWWGSYTINKSLNRIADALENRPSIVFGEGFLVEVSPEESPTP